MNDQIIKHVKENIMINYQRDPLRVINELVSAVSSFLSCEVDVKSFSKYKRTFELDCKKALSNIFFALFEKESTFLIFPDVVPGFTTMMYKKDISFFSKTQSPESFKKVRKVAKSRDFDDSPVNFIFNSFFEQNEQMVLWIESDELVMILCPVSDLEKYFKELEQYV